LRICIARKAGWAWHGYQAFLDPQQIKSSAGFPNLLADNGMLIASIADTPCGSCNEFVGRHTSSGICFEPIKPNSLAVLGTTRFLQFFPSPNFLQFFPLTLT
jgi:hypothetical protein